jgi:hypothetical protein
MKTINTTLIQTGDLLECKGSGFLSKGIKLFTKSDVTHTAVAIYIWGQLYIIDAQNGGVFPRPFNTWMREYNYDFEVVRSPFLVHEENFAKRAMTMSGSHYDRELFAIANPKEILFKQKLDQKFKGNGKFICSEYAAWCHNIDDAFKFTPGELKDYRIKHDWKSIMVYKK